MATPSMLAPRALPSRFRSATSGGYLSTCSVSVASNSRGTVYGLAQYLTTATKSCVTDRDTIISDEQAVKNEQQTIALQQTSLAATKAGQTVDAATIAQDEQTVTQDQQTVTSDEEALTGTVLKASISGTVTAVNGSVGETVSGGSTSSAAANSSANSAASSSSSSSSSGGFVTIDDLKDLEVVAGFAEADATKIAVGQPATVTLAALPSTEVAGVVTATSPTSVVASNVVTYDKTIALRNPPPTVLDGMTADVSVVVETATNVLEVPSAAVTTTGATSTVTVQKNGKDVTTRVTVGLVGSSTTQILSGVTAAEACGTDRDGLVLVQHDRQLRPDALRWGRWWLRRRRRLRMRSRKLFGQRTGEALDRLRALPPPGTSAPVNSTPARGKRPVVVLRSVSKTYSTGAIEISRAPPGLAERRGRRLRRHHGNLRVWQVDDDRDIIGCLTYRRGGIAGLEGVDVRLLEESDLYADPQPQDRFCLPELQPDTADDCFGERGARARLRRREAERTSRAGNGRAKRGRSRGPQPPPPERDVRRPAASTSPIARALVTAPALILADEPTGNLDTASSDEVMAIFTRLNAEGRTVVIITHETDIASFARRVVRLRDGQIYEDSRIVPVHSGTTTVRREVPTEGVVTSADPGGAVT